MVRMAWITSGYIPSPRRMAVIAGTTFTQLVRMKVFLFLGLFAVALLALSSVPLMAWAGSEGKSSGSSSSSWDRKLIRAP